MQDLNISGISHNSYSKNQIRGTELDNFELEDNLFDSQIQDAEVSNQNFLKLEKLDSAQKGQNDCRFRNNGENRDSHVEKGLQIFGFDSMRDPGNQENHFGTRDQLSGK